MTNFLQLKINIRKSYRQPQYIFQVVCEDTYSSAELIFRVFFCPQQYPKSDQAIHFMYPIFFCKIRSLPKTYKKIKGIRSLDSKIFIPVINPS